MKKILKVKNVVCILVVVLLIALIYNSNINSKRNLLSDQLDYLDSLRWNSKNDIDTQSKFQSQKNEISVYVNDMIENEYGKRIYINSNKHVMFQKEDVRDLFQTSIHLYHGKEMIIEQKNKKISIIAGQRNMKVNGKKVKINDQLLKKKGNWYVPADVLEKAFGYTIQYNIADNKIEITGETDDFLPASYSYIKEKRAPAIKDQGYYSTCWAFASLSALESSILPEEKKNFSCENMVLNGPYKGNLLEGGNAMMSTAYLTSWKGPVLEKDDVYGDEYTPKNLKAVNHVQEIQLPESGDRQEVKKMVYQYGGVESSLYIPLTDFENNSPYYNSTKSAYYYNGNKQPNHEVVIIGWDDHYKASNFVKKVKGDGAWICRNSWGKTFGDDGNFYVSYYDKSITQWNLVYTKVESNHNYDHIYQSDLCGWIGSVGFAKTNNVWFANTYKTKKREDIKAVSFYATGIDCSYEVYVIEPFENKDSLLVTGDLVATGTLKNKGYYTITLDEAVALPKGRKFAIVVKMNSPGNMKPIAVEAKIRGSGLNVNTKDGEGYYSPNGMDWLRAEKDGYNICLKAFTVNR